MIIVYGLLLSASGLLLVTSATPTDAACGINKKKAPIITANVSEIILENGQNYTLTCKSNVPIAFRQQNISEEHLDSTHAYSNLTNCDEEFSYESRVHIERVDQYSIGYYVCSNDYQIFDTINKITEEPYDTEDASYIYVYVNGTDTLHAPMTELVVPRGNKLVIECRPTTPDISVDLLNAENKTPDIVRYSPKIGYVLEKCTGTGFKCFGHRRQPNTTEEKSIRRLIPPPVPDVNPIHEEFLAGETLIFNCSATRKGNDIFNLAWTREPHGLPEDKRINIKESNVLNKAYAYLTIYNATEEDAGSYTCRSNNTCGFNESKPILKRFLNDTKLDVNLPSGSNSTTTQKYLNIVVYLDAYPPATYKFLKNFADLPNNTDKYTVSPYNEVTGQVSLKIKNVNITDTGNYTFVATNGRLTKNVTYQAFIEVDPVISFDDKIKKCVLGQSVSFECKVTGYPMPKITWKFTSEQDNDHIMESTRVEQAAVVYEKTAYLELPKCHISGNLTCIATKTLRGGRFLKEQKSKRVLVYEMNDGLGIQRPVGSGACSESAERARTLYAIQHERITVKCIASKYDFDQVTWTRNVMEKTVNYSNNSVSHIAALIMDPIAVSDSGQYTCSGWNKNTNTTISDSIQITVEALRGPDIEGAADVSDEVYRYKSTQLNCSASGVPLPQITWTKDGNPLDNGSLSNIEVYFTKIGRHSINSTIKIDQMDSENEGKYTCTVKSKIDTKEKTFTLAIKQDIVNSSSMKIYMTAIGVIIFILLVLVVYLVVRIRKEKAKRKVLAAAGLLYFRDGIPKSLNPELAIDEQAELLPYDDSFEFPPDKLDIGIQLGRGAFGVVYKAEARGIIDAEKTTTVAVKTVKKDAEHIFVKALASELKIMVHIGKHVNILNLLGACTKKVAKRELLVIVEYCMFGNIHNYMQKHREVFIDQITDKEKPLGKDNQAYISSTCGTTGGDSDYFGSANTQQTDNTTLNTANTHGRSHRKNIRNNTPPDDAKASEGYVQPEWRSNYQSDYSFDKDRLRPLKSCDLLAWSFQIARGMQYLADKKVLHGDLAARNILLAKDNIVKICDFGLARSIQKTNEYRTQSNNPLPVKWLAIECIDRGIFSTQSDVWSFGVVLWEIFSLAKTPYPGIKLKDVLPFLEAGNRLEKPPYADDRLYEVMKQCWHHKPTLRPSFSQLQEVLGRHLEDEVRNHYVDLNTSYMERNLAAAAAAGGGQEDYLAMVRAPDYSALVTPSPRHHYANENSFFPPNRPVPVDNEGYLQVSPSNQGIFSPRAAVTSFDFEPRKFNQNECEASCGSELTPMLTLNSLPARSGSESDHEGDGHQPFNNSCPRIDEEVLDDVFIDENIKNRNIHNTNIAVAVANPSYTLIPLLEKPQDTHSYMNVNGNANGLVK